MNGRRFFLKMLGFTPIALSSKTQASNKLEAIDKNKEISPSVSRLIKLTKEEVDLCQNNFLMISPKEYAKKKLELILKNELPDENPNEYVVEYDFFEDGVKRRF